MAKNKIQPNVKTEKASVATPVVETKTVKNLSGLPFTKTNYVHMLIGLGIIILGFVIMAMDKEPFGFGFLGLTLGPIIVFVGFLYEFYAILKK